MTEDASFWLVDQMDGDAVRSLASLIVSRRRLDPPVDILSVLAYYADIEELEWPHHCDAIAVGLGATKPKVFYKRLPASHRFRQRFTLAHELGHVVVPWHIGQTVCVDVADPERSMAAESPRRSGNDDEGEATRFAESILLPYAFLANKAQAGLSSLFDSLQQAEMSTMATLLAIRKIVLPGFVFEFQGSDPVCITSLGTKIQNSVPSLGDTARGSVLRQLSHEFGRTTIGGRQVEWYRLSEYEDFRLQVDERTTSEILRAAIGAHFGEAETTAEFRRINGIVAGSLGHILTRDHRQSLSILRHKISGSDISQELQEHLDFDLYLHRKVEERISRLTAP